MKNILVDALLSKNQTEARNLFDAQIRAIEMLYKNLLASVLNLSDEEANFNRLPNELRILIAQKAASTVLSGIQESLMIPLVELFDRFAAQEARESFSNKINNLANLSFREWRHYHQNLFLFQSPPKKSIQDVYACLSESLSQKITGYQIPLVLRKCIIEEISRLDIKHFNKPGFLQAIDAALISSGLQTQCSIKRKTM